MKAFIKNKWWRAMFLCYAFIYLPWFFTLEKVIQADHPRLTIIHCALDDKIPFIEYFIIPYDLWFLYVAVTCVFMFFIADNYEYLKFALSLVIGMTICLFICTVFPNGLQLRPDNIPDNFCGNLVAHLYTMDTNTNVFPSIHVYNSLVVNFALLRSKTMTHKFIEFLSCLLCFLICLSTVFLKQHSVIDAVAGTLLFIVLHLIIYKIDYKKIIDKYRKAN